MPEIRRATFSDIPAVGAMLENLFLSSRYSKPGWALDRDQMYGMLFQCVAANAAPVDGAQAIFVAMSDEGKPCGVIVGGIGKTYQCLSESAATDYIWFTEKSSKTPAGAAEGLIDAFHAWAASGGVRRQVHIISETGVVSPHVVMRLMRRKGFAVTGYVMEREIEI